jgi:serine protease inhibitor
MAPSAEPSIADATPSERDPAFDLLRLVPQQQATVLLSPLSVEAALTLLSSGAAGVTQREIRGFAGDSALSALHRLRGVNAPAAESDATRGTVLAFASCLWSPPHLRFSDAFSRIAQRDFAAATITSEAAVAPARLNEWVARTTRGLIPSVLDKPPDPTSVVLANAIAFLGKWMVPFDPALTAPGQFHEVSGGVRTAQMMARAGRFRYAAVPGGQLIDLPYDDGRLSFRVFLPEERQGLEKWLEKASAKSWRALGATLQEAFGELLMPRMDLAFSAELKPALERLGVVAAFRPGVADFSPLTAEKARLFVGSVIHRVVVKVDEAGTKAAASTTVQMTGATPPRTSFRMVVDHPFLFAIHGAAPEDLLFLGAVRAL